MKLMVCGSRSIVDSAWVFDQIDQLIAAENISMEDLVIVDGGAKGVDALAAHWANAHQVPIEWHRADWARYHRGAGIRRNEEMVETCDLCLILWDGVSKGTKNDIDLCCHKGKRYKLIKKS